MERNGGITGLMSSSVPVKYQPVSSVGWEPGLGSNFLWHPQAWHNARFMIRVVVIITDIYSALTMCKACYYMVFVHCLL